MSSMFKEYMALLSNSYHIHNISYELNAVMCATACVEPVNMKIGITHAQIHYQIHDLFIFSIDFHSTDNVSSKYFWHLNILC